MSCSSPRSGKTPALSRSLQRAFRPRRIVCIGSGGCTALSLLDDELEHVFSVDMNPAQCALLELKKESIRELNLESYLSFIGEGPEGGRLETYRRLAPRLPAYARDYWDGHAAEVDLGVNQCGVTERFYRFVGTNLRRNVVGDDVWRELFACGSVEAQRTIYEKHFATDSWRTAIRVLLSRTTHLLFYPAFMFAQSTEDDMGRFFALQFEREVCSKLLADNYFLSQLLFSSYLPCAQGQPRYLTLEGYAAVQRNIDKLVVMPASLQEFLQRAEGLDAFFLSNVFDWANPDEGRRIRRRRAGGEGQPKPVLLYRNTPAGVAAAHTAAGAARRRRGAQRLAPWDGALHDVPAGRRGRAQVSLRIQGSDD